MSSSSFQRPRSVHSRTSSPARFSRQAITEHLFPRRPFWAAFTMETIECESNAFIKANNALITPIARHSGCEKTKPGVKVRDNTHNLCDNHLLASSLERAQG